MIDKLKLDTLPTADTIDDAGRSIGESNTALLLCGLVEESVGLPEAESACLGDGVLTLSCSGECRIESGVGRNRVLPFVGRDSGEKGGTSGRSVLGYTAEPGVRPEPILAESEPAAIGFPELLASS